MQQVESVQGQDDFSEADHGAQLWEQGKQGGSAQAGHGAQLWEQEQAIAQPQAMALQVG